MVFEPACKLWLELTMLKHTLTLSTVLLFGSQIFVGCTSELDNKPAAKISELSSAQQAPSPPRPEQENAAAKPAGSSFALNTSTSTVGFVGAKITADHGGSFGTTTGSATVTDNTLSSLNIRVDTTTLSIEPPKLQAHLSSPDFFDTQKYKTASFELTKAEPRKTGNSTHDVHGELEIHGVKKAVTFPAKIIIQGNKVDATASFKINRSDFGITYKGMADDLIKDEVLLNLDLHFRK